MNTDGAAECIYCRRVLPLTGFTREHVLSRAFGRFTNAPVLHNSVCRACNQFFGDELETRVARWTFEGMLRYQRGTKKPDAGRLDFRFVKFTIPEGSVWSGVRLRLAWRDGRLVADLISQVAFLDRAKSLWVHLTDEEIEGGALLQSPSLDTRTVRVYARSLEDQDRLLRLLETNGIKFERLDDMPAPVGMFDGSDILVEVTLTVNKGIRRCVAKYGFNFLAFVCGSAFVLDKEFDPIRRFIRYGEMATYPLVSETVQPILRQDTAARRQTGGHLLTINWAASGVDLVGQVSLFNSITYSISLARKYGGILWRPIRSGLHFDVRQKTVRPLFGCSHLLLP